MHPLTRATATALLVFWALCALFFMQPFTGQFIFVALPAAAIAAGVFLAMRSRDPLHASPAGPGAAGMATIVFGIILILLSLMFATVRLPMLWDPCHSFDDRSTSGVASPDEPCASSSSTGQSRAAFIADSLAAEGVMMLGGSLAVWAGVRRHRGVAVAVGGAMVLPTFILFRGMSMAFMVTFLLGLGFVGLALMMGPRRRVEGPPPSA